MDLQVALSEFVDAAEDAFGTYAQDERSRSSLTRIFTVAKASDPIIFAEGHRPAFSKNLLGPLLAADYEDARLNRLMAGFREIEPHIRWRPRPVSNGTASANFPDNHANGMVFGPGGIVEDKTIMIGASLLAPHVRYPDHNHAPEETYLVMTEGEFRQEDNDWFSPGRGGSFYNRPGIKHAMRSGSGPLLAFWALHT